MNAEDIRNSIGALKESRHLPMFDLAWRGLPIYVEPDPPPLLKLSDTVNVSDEFRKDFDEWLLAEFGRKRPIVDRQKIYLLNNFGYLVNNENYHALSSALYAAS